LDDRAVARAVFPRLGKSGGETFQALEKSGFGFSISGKP
jgi:hypothetical protein